MQSRRWGKGLGDARHNSKVDLERTSRRCVANLKVDPSQPSLIMLEHQHATDLPPEHCSWEQARHLRKTSQDGFIGFYMILFSLWKFSILLTTATCKSTERQWQVLTMILSFEPSCILYQEIEHAGCCISPVAGLRVHLYQNIDGIYPVINMTKVRCGHIGTLHPSANSPTIMASHLWYNFFFAST